eukprot:6178896-Ditylum_brightwellii.AAC.1
MALRREGRGDSRCASDKAARCLLASSLRLFVSHHIFHHGAILGFRYPTLRTYKSYAEKVELLNN